MKKVKFDIYKKITESIINKLESGVIPWQKEWSTELPKNITSNAAYKGINLLTLLCTDYSSAYWGTFNQIKDMGGVIKKGEKGTPICFYKKIESSEVKEGKELDKSYAVIRYSTVFNLEQCEGLKGVKSEGTGNNPVMVDSDQETLEHRNCRDIISKYRMKHSAPTLLHCGIQPYYNAVDDSIVMPKESSFHDLDGYYSTLFHEAMHSTGHKKRLNRDALYCKKPLSYATEELIAEIGTCFLCAHTGIIKNTIDNAASYIDFWLKQLKESPIFLFQASSAAQKGFELITDS